MRINAHHPPAFGEASTSIDQSLDDPLTVDTVDSAPKTTNATPRSTNVNYTTKCPTDMHYPMWTLLVLLMCCGTPSFAQFCPTSCQCNDSTLSVVCDGGGLGNIPIMLNPRTRSLSLRDNQLSGVLVDELSFFTHLRYLDLSNNKISSIEKDSFKRLSHLTTLLLNDNSLPLLRSDVFTGLSTLRHLDVSNNKLSTIGLGTFADLQNLRVLNVSYNAIDNVSTNAFEGLGRLTSLDLQQNFVIELTPETLEPLPSLQSLDVSYNRLSHLPAKAFSWVPNLLQLSLSHNRLEDISPSSFDGLSALRSLNLRNNQLTRVPTIALSGLSDLTAMDISANLFDSLPTSCLEGLARLAVLTIDKCPVLRSVEINAFSGLHTLVSLSLAFNAKLGFIDEMAFELPNRVRELRLNDNALKTIPSKLIDWRQLEIVTLQNNPWHCSCEHTMWLRDDVKMAKFASLAVCSSPPSVVGESLTEWSPSSLDCAQGGRTTFVTQLAIVVTSAAVCLLLVLLLLCCLHDRLFSHFQNCGKARSTGSSSSAIMRTSPYSEESYGGSSRGCDGKAGTMPSPGDVQRFMPPSMKQVQQVQQQHMYVQRRLSDHHQQQLPFRTYTPSIHECSSPHMNTYRPLTVVTSSQGQQPQHQLPLPYQPNNCSISTSETTNENNSDEYEEPCYASIPIYGEVEDRNTFGHPGEVEERNTFGHPITIRTQVFTPSIDRSLNSQSIDRTSSYRVLARHPVPLTQL